MKLSKKPEFTKRLNQRNEANSKKEERNKTTTLITLTTSAPHPTDRRPCLKEPKLLGLSLKCPWRVGLSSSADGDESTSGSVAFWGKRFSRWELKRDVLLWFEVVRWEGCFFELHLLFCFPNYALNRSKRPCCLESLSKIDNSRDWLDKFTACRGTGCKGLIVVKHPVDIRSVIFRYMGLLSLTKSGIHLNILEYIR